MGPPRPTGFRRVIWLVLLLALLSLGHAGASWWTEACGPAAAARAGMGAGAARPAQDGREVADPWALSPSGTRLGPGFGLEDRPGLLP